MKFLFFPLIFLVGLQGCAAVVAGSAWKWAGSKQSEAETKCKGEYNNYLDRVEKVNKERSKHNEAPEPLMSLKEYCHIDD